MDDSRWLRLVTLGLILAALAVGYFLVTGRLSLSSITRRSTPQPSVLGEDIKSSPVPSVTPSPTPSSAYNRIVERTQSGTQVLPKTGFPTGLAVVFSVSALISGWGLRKYPH